MRRRRSGLHLATWLLGAGSDKSCCSRLATACVCVEFGEAACNDCKRSTLVSPGMQVQSCNSLEEQVTSAAATAAPLSSFLHAFPLALGGVTTV